MVDSELAERARALLPEREFDLPIPSRPSPVAPERGCRRARRLRLSAVLLVVSAVVLVGALPVGEERSGSEAFRSAAETRAAGGRVALHDVLERSRPAGHRKRAEAFSATAESRPSARREPAPHERRTGSQTVSQPQKVSQPSRTRERTSPPYRLVVSAPPPIGMAARRPGGPGPLTWKPVPNAAAYLARVYPRGAKEPLIEIWTPVPFADLPASWLDAAGKEHPLAPGRYRWAVFPAVGSPRADSETFSARASRTGTFVLGPPR